MESASSATGRTRLQILDRLVWLSRVALGLNIAEPARARRRDMLRQYAVAGLRTLDEIQAADKSKQLTVPGIDTAKATAPAPKPKPKPSAPRTLDAIASELREARAKAARLAEEHRTAEERMTALDAEFKGAMWAVYLP
jgi:hypothetical protein